MGHSDPSVTLRVYGHLFEGVQEELTDRLDRRRQAVAPNGRPRSAPVVELPRKAGRLDRRVADYTATDQTPHVRR